MFSVDDPSNVLIPISLSTLPVSSVVDVDIYLRPRGDLPPVLLCAAGQYVDNTRFNEMVGEGVTRLYIHSGDRESYQRTLRENLEEKLRDQDQPVIQRATILNEVIRDVLSEEFTRGSTNSIVAACQHFGHSAAQIMSDDAILLNELCRVLHHDYGTFTHSTNVSAFAVVLARALGFGEEDLKHIAIGGLLHDLGKLGIDERILNKPGKLDDQERRVIETHPSLGLTRLADREDLSEGELMMIYQHHERMEGSGYPVGITSSEIHPWARICAVVDVFEALTSHRPYRQRLSTQTALAILEKNEDREFDPEMVRCWRKLLEA